MQQAQLVPLEQHALQIEPEPDNQAWIASDEFRMYHFKITLCSKRFNHDWNFCPFAHAGERACRRDPLRYNYTSVTCLDMLQKGKCPRGDACGAAHSVFEYWLHPHRYRTEMCKVGAGCNRRICFFAHQPEEMRTLPEHLVNACAQDGAAAGKYSLSAALPGGNRSKDNHQQQQPQPGKAGQQQQQQDGAAAQKRRQGMLSGPTGFAHGISSSGSSSTSIINLSNSMLGSTNSSNNNSPLAATTGWLLPAGREEVQAGTAVVGKDPLAFAAPGAITTSSTLVGPVQLAATHSPHRVYNAAAGGLGGSLPPRALHMGAVAGAAYVQHWQQMPVTAGGAAMRAAGTLGGMEVHGGQQMMVVNMQQQVGLASSTGLTLQLQQLNLSDMGAAAGGVPMSRGLAAVGTAQGDMLPGRQLFSGNWQQQQHMVAVSGLPVAQQQQQSLLTGQGTAGTMAAVNSSSALAAVNQQAIGVDPQQLLLLQGHACVMPHTSAMCGVALPGQQYGQQQQLNFLQPGAVLAEGSWQP